MAYIKELKIHKTVNKAIDYIINPEKTNGQTLVATSGFPVGNANILWENIRKQYGKDKEILAHHFVQSFDPKHNITPEEALKIGIETAKRQFGRLGFDFIVSTHVDTGVIHNHILVNNVSRFNGDKYYHNNKTYRFLRQLNIDICRENGIPAVDNGRVDELYKNDGKDIVLSSKYTNSHSVTYNKTDAYKNKQVKSNYHTGKIRQDIDKTIAACDGWEDFRLKMEELGYRIDDKTKAGADKKYVTYFHPEAVKGIRDRSLGLERYSKEAILKRIHENSFNKFSKVHAGYSENKKQMYQRYELNPKWEKVMFSLKSNYRRRSYLEQLLIMTLLKEKPDKPKIVDHKKAKARCDNFYQKSRKLDTELERQLQLIQLYKLKNQNDLRNKLIMLGSELEAVEEKMKDTDNLIYKIEELQKLKEVENYQSMNVKDKKAYLSLHKQDIHKYEILKRELNNLGIDLSDSEKVLSELYDKQNELNGDQNKIMEMKKDIENISGLVRRLEKIDTSGIQDKKVVLYKEVSEKDIEK